MLLYFLIYKSTLENVTQNSENKSFKNRATLSLFFRKDENFSVSL